MNKNFKTRIYRRNQFVQFVSACKESVVHRENSTIITKIKILSSTGKLIPGTLINTSSTKLNVDTIADKRCSYIVLKTISALTKTGVQDHTYLMIFDGYTVSKSIKNIAMSIKNRIDTTIYTKNHLSMFLEEIKDVDERIDINGEKIHHTIKNTIIYNNDRVKLDIGLYDRELSINEDQDIVNKILSDTDSIIDISSLDVTSSIMVKQVETIENNDEKDSNERYIGLIESYDELI